MEELKVVGHLIKSDLLDVQKIDATIGNRSFEDTKEELIDMGVEEDTLEDIEFYSHLGPQSSDTNADVIAQYVRSVGLECKGIAPSKRNSKDNFKYWGKGIIDQMLDIHDTSDCDKVGIAIPKSCTELLRGILSSHYSEIDEQMAKKKDPEDLYGERKSDKIELCQSNDLIFLVGPNDIEIMDCRTFFGLK